ncbi:unnamed protein product [Urochloa humidicola]
MLSISVKNVVTKVKYFGCTVCTSTLDHYWNGNLQSVLNRKYLSVLNTRVFSVDDALVCALIWKYRAFVVAMCSFLPASSHQDIGKAHAQGFRTRPIERNVFLKTKQTIARRTTHPNYWFPNAKHPCNCAAKPRTAF